MAVRDGRDLPDRRVGARLDGLDADQKAIFAGPAGAASIDPDPVLVKDFDLAEGEVGRLGHGDYDFVGRVSQDRVGPRVGAL